MICHCCTILLTVAVTASFLIGKVDTSIFMNVTDTDNDFGLAIGLLDSYKTVTIWCNCPNTTDHTNVGRMIFPDGGYRMLNFTHQELVFRLSKDVQLGDYTCHCVGQSIRHKVKLPYRLCTLEEHLAVENLCNDIRIPIPFCIMRSHTRKIARLVMEHEHRDFCKSMRLISPDCDLQISARFNRKLCIGWQEYHSECDVLLQFNYPYKMEVTTVIRSNRSVISTQGKNCTEEDIGLQVMLMETIQNNVDNASNVRTVFYGERALVSRNDSLYIVCPTYNDIYYQFCYNKAHWCSGVEKVNDRTLIPIFRSMEALSTGSIVLWIGRSDNRTESFTFYMNFIVQDIDLTTFPVQACGKIKTIACRLLRPIHSSNVMLYQIKWIHNGVEVAMTRNYSILVVNVIEAGEYLCEVAIFYGLFHPSVIERKFHTRALVIAKRCLADASYFDRVTSLYTHVLICLALLIIGVLLLVLGGIIIERRQKRESFAKFCGATPSDAISLFPRSAKSGSWSKKSVSSPGSKVA